MNITFDTEFLLELTEEGIIKYFDYITEKASKLQDVYQFTPEEIASIVRGLESNIKEGNKITLKLSELCNIFSSNSLYNNYSKYVKDGIISLIEE